MLLVKSGTVIPENLRCLAHVIEEFTSDEDVEFSCKRLRAKLDEL